MIDVPNQPMASAGRGGEVVVGHGPPLHRPPLAVATAQAFGQAAQRHLEMS
ncbi:hypothetical protein [Streptomyces sp. NPDC019890]|uniref:hypothetical protein n=1 Tax=Streptomyces sp. NPDC019890 TaxID=3365064 RepID=UPI003850A717